MFDLGEHAFYSFILIQSIKLFFVVSWSTFLSFSILLYVNKDTRYSVMKRCTYNNFIDK